MPFRARLPPATHLRRRGLPPSELVRPATFRPLSAITSRLASTPRSNPATRHYPLLEPDQRRHVSLESFFPNVMRAWRDRQRSKSPASTPMTAVQDFRDALRPLRPPRIPLVGDMAQAYSIISLQAERQAQAREQAAGESSRTGAGTKGKGKARPAVALLSAEDVDEALEKLAALSNGDQLLQRLWADLDLLGLERTAQRREWVVRGLCLTGRPSAAAELVQDESGALEPASRELWLLVLETTLRLQPPRVPQVTQALRASLDARGEVFDVATYELLAQYASRTAASKKSADGRRWAEKFLFELERDFGLSELEVSHEYQAGIARAYTGLGDLGRAEAITAEWASLHPEELSEQQWATLFALQQAKQDVQGLIELMRRISSTEVPVPRQAWTMAMDTLSTPPASGSAPRVPASSEADKVARWVDDAVARLDQVEALTGCHPGTNAWIAIVTQLGDTFNPKQAAVRASALWTTSYRRGVPTDLPYAAALISTFSKPDPPDVESTLDVYRELFDSAPQFSTFEDYSLLWTMHQQILKGLARLSVGYPHVGHNALSFLTNMRSLGIHAPASPNDSSIVCGLMRRSNDHAEAFNVYAAYRALPPGTFSEEAYGAILGSFIAYTWPHSAYPDPNHFDTILGHMWEDGIPGSGTELSALVAQYGRAASQIQDDHTIRWSDRTRRLEEIHKAVADLHFRWRLDLKTEVRTTLLNVFMDAYQRLGATEGLSVWTELMLRFPAVVSQYEQNPGSKAAENELRSYQYSVAIALDMCSHARWLGPARRIWDWALEHQDEFVPASQAWERRKLWRSYLETLLRLGQWDEALDHLRNSARRTLGPGVGRDELQVSVTFLRSASKRVQKQWCEAMYAEMRGPWDEMSPAFKQEAEGMRDQEVAAMEDAEEREAEDEAKRGQGEVMDDAVGEGGKANM